jgi:hypothetical protein
MRAAEVAAAAQLARDLSAVVAGEILNPSPCTRNRLTFQS